METRIVDLVFEGPVPPDEREHLLPFLNGLGWQGTLPRDLRDFSLGLPSVPTGGTFPLVDSEVTLECVLPATLLNSPVWSVRVEDRPWGRDWLVNGRPFLSRLDRGPFPPSQVPVEVVNLLFAGYFSFPDCRQLPGFLAGLPRLESLMLHRFAFLEDLRVLAYCGALRHLSLATERLPSVRILTDLRGLRTLRLEGCYCLAGLDGLQFLENLEKLEIRHCPLVRDLGPVGNLRDLRHLALVDCDVADLSPLAHLESVETLTLADLPRLEKVAPMGPKPRLRDFSVHQCPKVANLRCLHELEGLRHCSLHGFTGKRVQPVFALPNLASLDLSGCTLEDQALEGLLRIPGLEALALTAVEDPQHLYQVECLLNLRRLEIQACIKLTTLRFLRYLARLEVLDLTMCLQVPSLDVLGGLGAIRRLGISAVNPGAMDPGFLSGMPNLTDLRMSGWYRLQNLGCLRRNTRLEQLDIRGCHGLTSLAHLAAMPERIFILCDEPHREMMRGGLADHRQLSSTDPEIFHPLVIQRYNLGHQPLWPPFPDPRMDLGQHHLVQTCVRSFINWGRKATNQGTARTANQNRARKAPV